MGGSAPQPPPRCLLFLSWVLMARRNPLGPRPKSTTCRLFRLPRFRSGNLRGARSSASGHPSGPAHAPGGRANEPAGTEHAWEPRPANLLQRGGAFPGGPAPSSLALAGGPWRPILKRTNSLETWSIFVQRSLGRYSREIETCGFQEVFFSANLFV